MAQLGRVSLKTLRLLRLPGGDAKHPPRPLLHTPWHQEYRRTICMSQRLRSSRCLALPQPVVEFRRGNRIVCITPSKSVRVSIALAVRLHVDALLESHQSSQSHDACAGTSSRKRRAIRGIPASAARAFRRRFVTPRELFREVATHRSRITMCVLALVGWPSGLR